MSAAWVGAAFSFGLVLANLKPATQTWTIVAQVVIGLVCVVIGILQDSEPTPMSSPDSSKALAALAHIEARFIRALHFEIAPSPLDEQAFATIRASLESTGEQEAKRIEGWAVGSSGAYMVYEERPNLTMTIGSDVPLRRAALPFLPGHPGGDEGMSGTPQQARSPITRAPTYTPHDGLR